jgi:segregation and condensation protein B
LGVTGKILSNGERECSEFESADCQGACSVGRPMHDAEDRFFSGVRPSILGMDATITNVTDDSPTILDPTAPLRAVPTTRSARKEARAGRGEEAAPDPWVIGAVEAVLLSLSKPMSSARIADGLCGRESTDGRSGEPSNVASLPGRPTVTPAMVDAAVSELNRVYEASSRSFRIERVANGYRVMTLSVYVDAVARFHESRAGTRLSRAAVESLAIIAYKQPITRAHLEAIRGVNCGEVLRSLLERQLVVISGRAEELGRPMLYSTGPKFLTSFGLASIKDLPSGDPPPGGEAALPAALGANGQNPPPDSLE